MKKEIPYLKPLDDDVIITIITVIYYTLML